MAESVLKKEFKERDVNRARNLLTGKQGAATQIASGYEKQVEERGEGDIWEENGKQWTIKNGLKQTVTKLDEFKKTYHLPYSCPCCKKSFQDTPTNRKMWAIHQMCLDCVVEMEAKLKIEGKYEEYEKRMLNGNKNSMMSDLEVALDEWLNSNNSFITEQGDVENWGKKVGNDADTQALRELIQKAKETEI
jgi:hypothetical protein